MTISIGDAILKIGVDKKDFDRDMKGLRGSINKHKKAIGIAMVGMGVAAIGAAVASIKAFASMGDEVQKMALRTGLSTEALSELRHAAEISGASLSTIEKGIKKMSKTIVDADEGMATYIRSFDRIGLSARELMELSPEEQFTRITEAIAELESPTLRAATAQDIFGRAGTELLPLMAEGKEGLIKLRQEAHKLGIVFDQEAANAAAEFNDSLTRLSGAINGVKFTLARELMPAMEAGIPLLETWARALGPIIENTLNWHAAYDKQIKQKKAWQGMMLERQKFIGGLNNELGNSLNLLESVLRNQGQLNEQSITTIARLRDEIKARKDHEEVIEDVNEDLEEQNKLLEEQQEAYEKTTEMIQDVIEELEYETSTAGELRIGIDDIIKALHLMGLSNEEITETLVALGDEQDNVNTVLGAFGVTAVQVAERLGINTDAVDALTEANKKTKEAADEASEAIERQGEVAQAVTTMLETYGSTSQQITGTYPAGWGMPSAPLAPGTVIAPGVVALQQGGIAMRPMLASIAERKPEAIIPLDRLEGMLGSRKVNIYVELDGRTIARAIGAPLVDLIRVKTGAKL